MPSSRETRERLAVQRAYIEPNRYNSVFVDDEPKYERTDHPRLIRVEMTSRNIRMLSASETIWNYLRFLTTRPSSISARDARVILGVTGPSALDLTIMHLREVELLEPDDFSDWPDKWKIRWGYFDVLRKQEKLVKVIKKDTSPREFELVIKEVVVNAGFGSVGRDDFSLRHWVGTTLITSEFGAHNEFCISDLAGIAMIDKDFCKNVVDVVSQQGVVKSNESGLYYLTKPVAGTLGHIYSQFPSGYFNFRAS